MAAFKRMLIEDCVMEDSVTERLFYEADYDMNGTGPTFRWDGVSWLASEYISGTGWPSHFSDMNPPHCEHINPQFLSRVVHS